MRSFLILQIATRQQKELPPKPNFTIDWFSHIFTSVLLDKKAVFQKTKSTLDQSVYSTAEPKKTLGSNLKV